METRLNSFPRLLGQARPATAAPAAPAGGASWDAGLAPTGFGGDSFQPSAPSGTGLVRLGGGAAEMRQAMLGIFQAGVQRDLAGANQLRTLSGYLAPLTAGQLTSIAGLLNQAGTPAEQVFILKAYTAGEPWQNLVQYAGEMRGQSEAEIISRSTMRDDADLIQQWQDSCGSATLQTIAGEADPRFAWELNKAGDLARIDPLGAAQEIARQQQQWLEQYGGKAVERGQSGGQGMALGLSLNENISAITGATYQTTEVADLRTSLDRVESLLKDGYDVPLRVEWSPPGAGPGYGHFILAMQARGAAGSREFQIHDPWTGKTAWVPEASMAQNSFQPIFNSYARLTHTYEAQPAA